MTEEGPGYSWQEVQRELAQMFEDQKKLYALRLSLARVAQKLGVRDEVLLTDPLSSCRNEPSGWNTLAALCIEEIDILQSRVYQHEVSPDGC